MSSRSQFSILSRRIVTISIATISILGAVKPFGSATVVLAQGGGYDSTILLQMPFIAGQTWTVGNTGSFYGEGNHNNTPADAFYATDWNTTNDNGMPVIPIADGTVIDLAVPDGFGDCPDSNGYGCFVEIQHSSNYRSKYAHLSEVHVIDNQPVKTSTLIGLVGSTGSGSTSSHLHLGFSHFDSGAYHSRCWNGGNPCPPNNMTPMLPQGTRPSPMMTASGPTTLVDAGIYTSVNGRVYLPDLRRNSGGWTTELWIRNDGTVERTFDINFFLSTGGATPYSDDDDPVPPNGHDYLDLGAASFLPSPSNGTAYVDGGEAFTVVVMQRRSSPTAWAAYVGVSQHNSEVFVPLLQKNNYSVYSEVYIRNNGNVASDITIGYTVSPAHSGNSCSHTYDDVPANSQLLIEIDDETCIGSTFVGSGRISSSPSVMVAVASTQRKSDNSYMGETSFSDVIAQVVYAPLVQNNNSGWTSGIGLLNATGSAQTLSANFSNKTGVSNPCATGSYGTYQPRQIKVIASPGGSCTTVASSKLLGGSYPVAATVNQVTTTQFSSYEAIATLSKKVVIPLWRNAYNGWISGMAVQNPNSSTANITVRYYNSTGGPGTIVVTSIPAYGVYTANATGQSYGSAVITSDQPIAAIVNQVLTTGTGDLNMSHIGIPR